MTPPLTLAIEAPRRDITSVRAGRLSYYVDTTGSGRPLVLLHSVNAAPSAMEVKPFFEHYRGKRPVYALELPGFGFSERGDRDYTAALYVAAIVDFLDSLPEGPLDLLALSLSAEFAAGAASERPERVASLVLVSPTGFGLRAPPGEAAGRRIRALLGVPGLGAGLFRSLTTRPVIRRFLRMSFQGRVPVALVDYAWRSARQPGARFAPFRFLGFGLFARDAVAELYRPVAQPALVLYDRDPNVSFERLAELATAQRNWRVKRIRPTRGLPHWEKPEETFAAMDAFWAAHARGA
jgi:pimeloyl-ACP methyl ester carboxylesterase